MKDNKIYKRILVLSDMHHPYSHPDTFKFLKALKGKFKFDKVVCIGDEIDGAAWSYHESNPDLPNAGLEHKLAIKSLKPIYKLFPKVDILESNHGSLVYRKAITAGLPAEMIKAYRDQIDAPKNWNWFETLKVNTALGPVFFCHGISGTPGKLSNMYSMSACQGHYHSRSQVTWISTPERLRFDMHVGCLIDDKSLAFKYNKLSPVRPIISVGIIVDGIAQIIPMVLNSKGSWVGRL
jgi:hypothetical protein